MGDKKEQEEVEFSSEANNGLTQAEKAHGEETKPVGKVQPIQGFSKLTKEQKIDHIIRIYFKGDQKEKLLLKSFWNDDPEVQKIFDEFSENTLSNFVFPFGIAPNVLINNQLYSVPMVIEESSVVAAASKAAKFWMERGGFRAEVLSTKKIGQVHLSWLGDKEELFSLFDDVKKDLFSAITDLNSNMKKRGGGLIDINLLDKTELDEGYYQIWAEFETCDAMGANFINSVLEELGRTFKSFAFEKLNATEETFQIIMAILSNYTPDSVVKVWVECPIEDLADKSLGMEPQRFAEKFKKSVRIAEVDTYRATTHNKGIMNGIDSVILATGNDFRAVEACLHTHAARNGRYSSLTGCKIENGIFRFEAELPMSLGTVGGLTALHPLAKMSLKILGKPSASELMMVAGVIGLAQNFAALRSLVTTGIQKGHMKMHLMNILNHLKATDEEAKEVKKVFAEKVISFRDVSEFIKKLRDYQ